MSIVVETEQETVQEGLDVLTKNLPPSKVARLLSNADRARGRRAFWRGNLLRESGHDFAGAPITLAAQNGKWQR
jgi:hypothetical protein